MALHMDGGSKEKYDETLNQKPGIQIFLQPIAPPAALGLAGFAGSTWITTSRAFYTDYDTLTKCDMR